MPVISHRWNLAAARDAIRGPSGGDAEGERGAMGPSAERHRWACPGELNPGRRCSCWRVGGCEFAARWLEIAGLAMVHPWE